MEHLRLTAQHDVSRWAGELAQDYWYSRVLRTEDAFVEKPDGSPLLCVVRGVITGRHYQDTYAAVAPLARSSPRHNRGLAAGKILDQDDGAVFAGGVAKGGHVGHKSATRYQPVKKDGTLSNTVYAKDTPSFVMGFADRSQRFPYCRQTTYTAKHPATTPLLLPTLRQLSACFATHLSCRYAAQSAVVHHIEPQFVFAGSVFTTVTINRNWQTALHTDKGDLPEGFGVMLCLRAGEYQGGLYVMPGFDIAVDLGAGDVLLSDVHEWHGNTALVGDPSRFERITLVCYVRTKMVECGSPAEEARRVKQVAHRRVYVR